MASLLLDRSWYGAFLEEREQLIEQSRDTAPALGRQSTTSCEHQIRATFEHTAYAFIMNGNLGCTEISSMTSWSNCESHVRGQQRSWASEASERTSEREREKEYLPVGNGS